MKEKDPKQKEKSMQTMRINGNVVLNYMKTNQQLGARIKLLHPICVQRCYDDIALYSPTRLLRRKIM